MIKNTELLYTKLKGFQDKRAELVDAHEKRVKSLERFKGSKGYEEDLKKENEKHEAELQGLRDKYRPDIMTIFGGMVDAIGRRSVAAPTSEQINLLHVLKMKRKVTLEECQRIGEALKDNPLACSLLTEIAHDHGIVQSFDNLCPEMSSENASAIVSSLKDGVDDFLQYDTTRASRMASGYIGEHYGTEGELTKRKLFTDQAGFYHEMGLVGDTFSKFSEIVDHG